jgi:hypothetical protein
LRESLVGLVSKYGEYMTARERRGLFVSSVLHPLLLLLHLLLLLLLRTGSVEQDTSRGDTERAT